MFSVSSTPGETRGSRYPYLWRHSSPSHRWLLLPPGLSRWPGTQVPAARTTSSPTTTCTTAWPARTYTNVVAAGTNLTVSISNLVEGTTYYFAATAVDTNGLESDYSAEVSRSLVTEPPPTLNALANLTINEGASLQTVNLSGITTGSSNEIARHWWSQPLRATPASFRTPRVSYTSPNATGSITFTPVAYANGCCHNYRHRQQRRRQQQHRLPVLHGHG